MLPSELEAAEAPLVRVMLPNIIIRQNRMAERDRATDHWTDTRLPPAEHQHNPHYDSQAIEIYSALVLEI
jgi:hypothetical protein